MRRRRTAKQRLAIFTEHRGVCHICGGVIDGTREAWEMEHVIPLAMGGEDEDYNLRPAHVKCHRGKSATDAGNLAKARRVEARHKGAHRAKALIPGSKGSGWRKPLNGPAYRVKE